jgi:hypothetical protein
MTVSLTADPATFPLGSSTQLTTDTTGGTSPFRYAYTALPAGCASVNASTLDCTPTSAAIWTVIVTVTDHVGRTAQANATLMVQSPPLTAGSTGFPTWEWIAIVVIALGVMALFFAFRGRKRKWTPPPLSFSPPPPPGRGPPPT